MKSTYLLIIASIKVVLAAGLCGILATEIRNQM